MSDRKLDLAAVNSDHQLIEALRYRRRPGEGEPELDLVSGLLLALAEDVDDTRWASALPPSAAQVSGQTQALPHDLSAAEALSSPSLARSGNSGHSQLPVLTEGPELSQLSDLSELTLRRAQREHASSTKAEPASTAPAHARGARTHRRPRSIGRGAAVLAVAAGLSTVSGVAAAVAGDPFLPIKSVIHSVVEVASGGLLGESAEKHNDRGKGQNTPSYSALPSSLPTASTTPTTPGTSAPPPLTSFGGSQLPGSVAQVAPSASAVPQPETSASFPTGTDSPTGGVTSGAGTATESPTQPAPSEQLDAVTRSLIPAEDLLASGQLDRVDDLVTAGRASLAVLRPLVSDDLAAQVQTRLDAVAAELAAARASATPSQGPSTTPPDTSTDTPSPTPTVPSDPPSGTPATTPGAVQSDSTSAPESGSGTLSVPVTEPETASVSVPGSVPGTVTGALPGSNPVAVGTAATEGGSPSEAGSPTETSPTVAGSTPGGI